MAVVNADAAAAAAAADADRVLDTEAVPDYSDTVDDTLLMKIRSIDKVEFGFGVEWIR